MANTLFEPIFEKLMNNPRSARAREALEASVGGIIEELLDQRGAPGKAELEAARVELALATQALDGEAKRSEKVEAQLAALTSRVNEMARMHDDLTLDLGEARVALVQAEAKADAVEAAHQQALTRINALEAALAAKPAPAEAQAPARRRRSTSPKSA